MLPMQGKEVAVKVLPKIRGKLTKDKTLEKLAREVGCMTALLESLHSLASSCPRF